MFRLFSILVVALLLPLVSLAQETQTFTTLDGRISFEHPTGWMVQAFGNVINITDADERNIVAVSLLDTSQIGNADELYNQVTGETLTANTLLQLFADELPEIRANMEAELGSSLGLPDATYEGTFEIGGFSGGAGFFGENPIYAFDIPEEGYLLVTLRGQDSAGMQVVFETVMGSLAFAPFSFDPGVYIQAITTANVTTLTNVTQYVLPGFGVRALTLTSDGLLAVSARAARWIDLNTAEVRGVFGDDDTVVLAADISPDKTIIAGGGDIVEGDSFDPAVRLWDSESGAEIVTVILDSVSRVRQVGFSPDGSILAVNAGQVFLIDVATGELLPEIEGARDSFSFSPDGTRIAANCPRMVLCVYDIATGEIATEFLNPEDRFPIRYNAVQFSPDGSTIAVGFINTDTNASSDLTLWDATTGELRFIADGQPDEFGDTTHDRGVTAIAFSPDGTLIASADENGELRLWDATTGAGLLLIDGAHVERGVGIETLAFSEDGTLLFSGGEDSSVRVWAVE